MRIVGRFCKVSWLKMNRASVMSPLNLSLLKACTHASRKYRYRSLCVWNRFTYELRQCHTFFVFYILLISPMMCQQSLNKLLIFQFLRQETESLWSEYANQCSQLGENTDQEKAGLQEQWRSQQSSLQRRGSSLGAALRQIDSTENHMVDFSDRLDRYLRQPKDITGFTLANGNILKDIKVSCQLFIHYISL